MKMGKMLNNRQAKITVILLFFFAITLQVLITPTFFGTPMRIALSDLLIPVSLALLLLWWRCGGITLPRWHIPHLWIWLAVISIWFGVEIINGRIHTGIWSTWALISKGLGWAVLLCYFFIGGWLASINVRNGKYFFFKSLILFGAFSCLVALAQLIAYKGGLHWYWGPIENYDRARGFSENVNAYSILLATLFVLLTAFVDRIPLMSRRMAIISAGVFFGVIILSVSRSGILAVIFGLIGVSILRSLPWRFLVHSGLAGLAVILLFLGAAEGLKKIDSEGDLGGAAGAYIVQSPIFSTNTVTHRSSVILSALELWVENPVIGSGLGSILISQEKRGVKEPSTVHNTAIWILVEMGLIGFALMAGFFFYVSFGIFRLKKAFPENPFYPGAFGMMMAFMGASIGTEVLYQRYFWFIAGVLLVFSFSPDSEPGNSEP